MIDRPIDRPPGPQKIRGARYRERVSTRRVNLGLIIDLAIDEHDAESAETIRERHAKRTTPV